MRGATECARRLKSLTSAMRARLGKVSPPAATDPITQMVLGILSRDTPETKASEGLERLREMVVDYNELRVIPPIELAAVLGDFPDARLKCEDISRALNAVFAQEHTIILDRLAELSRKDVLAALERIDGLEPYTRARVRLLGLRQHAIPLDEAMWALARVEGVVDPRCPLQEAQQFFERQIAEEDALEFVALLKKHAWNEMGGAVKRREVERILSVPPDRTTRNMLQTISASLAEDLAASAAEDHGAARREPAVSRPADAAAAKSKPDRKKTPERAAAKLKRSAVGRSKSRGAAPRGRSSNPRARARKARAAARGRRHAPPSRSKRRA